MLVDLQGPRVRTGLVKNQTMMLATGSRILIKIGSGLASGGVIWTSCKSFKRMLKRGDAILIDNGAIQLAVENVGPAGVACRVVSGGTLGQNKGINLPHAPVTLPALTPKDRLDLKAAVDAGADYVALSFVRSKGDMLTVKKWLSRHSSAIPLIAKIEKPVAVKNAASILALSDAVMIARGDLGIEMGIEKVPGVQKALIRQAADFKIPVITATQMLETMIEKPHPTRAEVSDIANAVFDGTDAVMLSGETAIGRYPVQAVRTMRRIVEEAERDEASTRTSLDKEIYAEQDLNLSSITRAAVYAAVELQADGIVVFTPSGKTARYISKLNPPCEVFAVSHSSATLGRVNLLRGVSPLDVKMSFNTDEMVHRTDAEILRLKLLKRGDAVVIVSGKQALPSALYMTSIHRIGERSRKRKD